MLRKERKGRGKADAAPAPRKEPRNINVKYIAKALVFIAVLIAAFMFIPVPYSLLAVIGIIAGFILVDAMRHRVLFKMARRNFTRRKGTTILVVAGLMVGTAIISMSFVVGDTMDNMIIEEITKGAGDVSFVIGAPDDQGSGFYYDASVMDSISEDIKNVDHVSAAVPVILDRFVVYDANTQLSSSSPFVVMGTNTSAWSQFGGWDDVSEGRILIGPTPNGCFINVDDAKSLGANVGDTLFLTRGAEIKQFVIERIVENYEPGVAGVSTSVFIDLGSMQDLVNMEGQTNFIFVKTDSFEGDSYYYNADVRDDIDVIVDPLSTMGFEVVIDVKEVLDTERANLKTFSDLFLVFGSFSVIAGIVLVINIFTMLGEERKSEMGMARALGMRRADLERLFTYEGLIYALVAAAIGTVIGVVLSYFMIWAISGMFDFFQVPMIDYFTYTAESLIIAFIGGFLITITTVYMATARISKLNIVRAVRNIPEPPISRSDSRSFRLGIVGLIAGALLMIVGIQGESAAPAYSGLSLMTISMALIIRKWIGDRIAWNLAALLTLFIWLPKGGFAIFDYTGGIEMFIVSGLFMVTSSLILVIFNSDALVSFMMKVLPVRNAYRAVLKTAASYPLRAKFRTGLSIFIFGLVIFTVTVLSMMSGILNVNIERMVIESSGGFDLVAIKQLPVPFQDDPWEMINSTGGFVDGENVTNLISVPSMPIAANFTSVDSVSGLEKSYERNTNIIGFSQRLFTEGEFPLVEWDDSIYASDDDVWKAALNDPDLVIVDGSWAQGMAFGPPGTPSMGSVEIGQTIRIESTTGHFENVTVIGIMKQQFFNGVFMSEGHVYNSFNAVGPSVMLIDFRGGLDVSEQAVLVEREFLYYGVMTLNVKEIAEEVTSSINNMFSLFEAYLAMGLIIGITGLGIITIRSIHERQLEIGMMRAIGYRKTMVVANFALESAFIAALGIIIGSILGIIVGYELFSEVLTNEALDFEFVINWVPIVLIGFGTLIATLLCVYPAARGASKVSPAEVLRFE